MSTAAIYNVTRGLRMLLRSQLARISSTAVVTLLPPGDTLPEVSGVNLYLYRVVEHPSFKNDPWRGDRTRPGTNTPALALQLFYLLTPLGARPNDASFDQGDDAHTMLGAAMSTLHENPVLNDIHLPPSGTAPGFDSDLVLPAFIQNSYEKIQIRLLPTTIDDLSKIWATINKPYRLSVAYEVSLAQITPAPPPPVTAAIVTSTGLTVTTLDPPRLISLTPPQGALARISAGALRGNTLEIRGFGFAFPGQEPIVRIAGEVARILDTPAPTGELLAVELPLSPAAGPQVDATVTLNARTSTPLVFTAQPWLATLRPIRTALAGASLKLQLAGAGFTATPELVRFDGPGGPVSVNAFDAGGNDGQATITIPSSLQNGVFEVRLVAGPAGANATNARTLEVIPRLDTPVIVTPANAPDGRPVSRLTLNGARLNGADVRVLIDGTMFAAGNNAAAAQLVYTMGRVLEAGVHRVSVQVDGHTSHTVEVAV